MCYILQMTRPSVLYIVSGVHPGFENSAPEKFCLSQEKCLIFSSFFMSPRFSCPLLGGFLAHGFCRWFSIFD
jgi:hypothetical protein